MADRERFLEIADAAEDAQHFLEQQRDPVALGASMAFALNHPSGTVFFTEEARRTHWEAGVARVLKLEALNRKRQMRWGGV